MQRALVAMAFTALLVGACWQNAAHYFSLPSLHGSQVLPDSFWARGNVHKNLASMAARAAKPTNVLARIPGVYPYSVVPGGVKDADDLRYAALRDYVVRRHYARFDFSNARLVRAAEPGEVYLSYRIRDTVFWTRRKVRLHAGELLLTDGNITARARCGNQISDTAKPEVSEEEPAEDVMDEPVASATEPSFPIHPMLAPPDLPVGVPTPPQIFAGGFYFPYVPITAGPIPPKVCAAGDRLVDGKCRPKRKNPVAPEPSTMVLIASGLVLILWRYKRTAPAIAS
ncbi:MAG: PEP-CTERM sorting domain-containing protein [Terriglobales bacterium]